MSGIDYGHGMTNTDPKNGIRYGVISQHSIGQAWHDESEADYGDPTCPKCGNKVESADNVETEHTPECALMNDTQSADYGACDCEPEENEFTQLYSHGCQDYACADCRLYLDSSDCFGEEPIGFTFSDSDYELVSCLDSDVMILKSPYYTFAQFCSPCVPGAGNLDNPESESDGVKTYCLGHDWFDDSVAPYAVFSVSDDSLVVPEESRT